MTPDQIRDYYDSHPNLTIAELARITGEDRRELKRILLDEPIAVDRSLGMRGRHHMTALATIDVCPLGRPGRFSMTPRQQEVYRILAATVGANAFRLTDAALLANLDKRTMHAVLHALIERGWACRVEQQHYALTSPVMSFREATQ